MVKKADIKKNTVKTPVIKAKPFSAHKNMVDLFKAMFPTEEVRAWWRKGPNAVKIRTGAKSHNTPTTDVIFTYNDRDDWKLESSMMYGRSEQAALAGK
jgi:hypothetical protein